MNPTQSAASLGASTGTGTISRGKPLDAAYIIII
tara:strand:- start:354 stop:455 length:102 start_codon:yes stop_codon:yes gene_type:complete